VGGYLFIGATWFPTSLYFRTRIKVGDAETWSNLLAMYAVAKVAYVAGVALTFFFLVRWHRNLPQGQCNPSNLPSLTSTVDLPEPRQGFSHKSKTCRAHKALERRIGKFRFRTFAKLFPTGVLASLMLYTIWVFYAYSFLQLRDDVYLQFAITGVLVPVLDVLFRVWLSGVSAKTLVVAFDGEINELGESLAECCA